MMMLVMVMKCSQKLIIGTCESTVGSQHVCKTVVTWKSGLARMGVGANATLISDTL